ncbi:MAG: hypothetical protein ACI92A_000379, partial [Candidatus Paceibacteria bacterium]
LGQHDKHHCQHQETAGKRIQIHLVFSPLLRQPIGVWSRLQAPV